MPALTKKDRFTHSAIFLLSLVFVLLILFGSLALYLQKQKTPANLTQNSYNPDLGSSEQINLKVSNLTGKIAYIHNGDIKVINPDGFNEQQLTRYGYNETPVWSPDGKKIAFRSLPESVLSDKSKNPECVAYDNVWIVNRDGVDSSQITNSEAIRSTPSWSPDSKQIIFTENEKLIVYDLSTKTKKIIASDSYFPETPNECGEGGIWIPHVSWSPKNSLVLYDRKREDSFLPTIINSKNGKIIKEIKQSGLWSPDGSKIAYVESTRGDPIVQTIVVISLKDGTQETYRPYKNYAGIVAWSPNGKELLYEDVSLKESSIRILNLKTRQDREVAKTILTDFKSKRRNSGIQLLFASVHGWSPDGSSILVTINAEEYAPEYKGITQLNIIDAQTGRLIRTLKETWRTNMYSPKNIDKGYYFDFSWASK